MLELGEICADVARSGYVEDFFPLKCKSIVIPMKLIPDLLIVIR